jgi:hypothetical protein
MNFFKIIILLSFLFFAHHCVAQLYKNDRRVIVRSLNVSELQKLRSFLAKYDSVAVQDTLMIAYNFNHEHCWDIMDQESPKNIQGFIERSQQWITKTKTERPSISVFQFRQKGNDINKFKKWDTSIRIDSTDQLHNLLFKDKCTCGSSAIVLPDGTSIITRSDPHFETLDYDRDKIQELLEKYK